MTSSYPVEHSPADGIFVRTQAEALAAAGVQVEVFSPRPWVPLGFARISSKWKCYAMTPVRYELNGIPVYRPRYLAPPKANIWLAPHRTFVRLAKKTLTGNYDVIHGHFAYPDGLAGVQLAKEWNLPSVLTLHGDDTNVHPLRNALARHRFCKSVQGAEAVVAVSNALARRAQALSDRMPVTLPIGIQFKKFSALPTQAEARRLLRLPSGPLILFVGRLLSTKGIGELLQVAPRLKAKGVTVVFVGTGPMAEQIRKTQNCHLAGLVSNEKIPLFMRAADVLALPSYSEGLPTVLVEAGAANIPVITTTVGGIPELVTEERGWLIPAKCSRSLQDAIVAVISNRQEARCRATRLHEVVINHYDSVCNAQKLLELYHTLGGVLGKRIT